MKTIAAQVIAGNPLTFNFYIENFYNKWEKYTDKLYVQLDTSPSSLVHLFPEIKNTLFYEDTQVELDPECVNVIKIKTTGKKTFDVKLSEPYIVNGDDRVLGIKITRIMIDQDVIF